MTNETEKQTEYTPNREQYISGKSRIAREMALEEMYCIHRQIPELEELLQPLFSTDAEANALFNKDSMRFAGMAREILSFGAKYGNPSYALLGARIYQKLGKGNRPSVLNAVRKSLENMHVSRETKKNNLDFMGSGVTITIIYHDCVANGYRVSEKEVKRTREYLENNSQSKEISGGIK